MSLIAAIVLGRFLYRWYGFPTCQTKTERFYCRPVQYLTDIDYRSLAAFSVYIQIVYLTRFCENKVCFEYLLCWELCENVLNL